MDPAELEADAIVVGGGLAGLVATAELASVGKRVLLLEQEPEASLVLPDGPGGTALLVFDNFRVIKKWNNSTYFAAAVGYIADSIDRG